jgi:23S rRNA pseudouridine2604 synthase
VDGRVISELGSRVSPGQQVELDRRGQTVQDRRVTILLNKPVGYVSGQAEDGYEPASVLITAENRWAEDPPRPATCAPTTGAWRPPGGSTSTPSACWCSPGRAHRPGADRRRLHHREGIPRARRRHARRRGPEAAQPRPVPRRRGLRPAKVSWLNEDQLRFVLREGKKRQIRRMCELVGLKVVGLKRVRIGRVMLGHLPPGQWRYLGPNEAF